MNQQTFAKRIIPCLDIKDGRVVKGVNFVGLKDAGDPVELAALYDKQGADELVFLDITASSDKRYILKDLVQRTAEQVFIPFTVGGGINDIATIRDMLNAGADKVSINTAAIKDPLFIRAASKAFGSQCIVVAIDARRIVTPSHVIYENKDVAVDENSIFEVFSHGGRHATGIDVVKWAKYLTDLGAGEILLTSMDADGTKAGYDLELTKKIANETSVPVIASGGAGTYEHISDALNFCDAALLASLLHFGEMTVESIKKHCQKKEIVVRF